MMSPPSDRHLSVTIPQSTPSPCPRARGIVGRLFLGGSFAESRNHCNFIYAMQSMTMPVWPWITAGNGRKIFENDQPSSRSVVRDGIDWNQWLCLPVSSRLVFMKYRDLFGNEFRLPRLNSPLLFRRRRTSSRENSFVLPLGWRGMMMRWGEVVVIVGTKTQHNRILLNFCEIHKRINLQNNYHNNN